MVRGLLKKIKNIAPPTPAMRTWLRVRKVSGVLIPFIFRFALPHPPWNAAILRVKAVPVVFHNGYTQTAFDFCKTTCAVVIPAPEDFAKEIIYNIYNMYILNIKQLSAAAAAADLFVCKCVGFFFPFFFFLFSYTRRTEKDFRAGLEVKQKRSGA